MPRTAGRIEADSGAARVPALIARQVLFGNPEKSGGTISPNGEWLGYLAPVEGALNIHVARRSAPDRVSVVTRDRGRGIRRFEFAFTNRHLLYLQDEGGDENFQLFAADLTTGESRALTPHGARAEIEALSPRFPDEVLVSVNDRNPSYFDLVRVHLVTGVSRRIVENEGFSGFVTDLDFKPRYASRQTPDGGKEWLVRDGAGWRPWERVPQEDAVTTGLGRFTADGKTLYLVDSRGRDTSAQLAIDTATGARSVLFEDPRADVGSSLAHPATGLLQAVVSHYLKPEWRVLDSTLAQDFSYLAELADGGELHVDARTLDDTVWVVRIDPTNASSSTYLYDRTARRARLWFEERPDLAGLPLQAERAVEIVSRDGLTLPSYYLLPPGRDRDGDGIPDRPVPLVLRVHGGPWDRDTYSLNGLNQWLANRGYAVLRVNFRGSTGFGKKFTNAGDREWGRKMQDDLLDAVGWAVERRIADPERVAILGGSYGGYSALAGIAMTPKAFACAVSVVGPSNLITLLATIPPYWGPTRKLFSTRAGDPETEAGRALLEERSPLTHAHRIERPLLIGQGANDPRVKATESEQIVAAMQAKGLPVTYVLFPDEGHGFVRTENDIAFSAVTEEFLARCLGGQLEPVGRDFAGSSITVPAGAELLPGVAASLPKR
jgi:dipeptidyl aminopeptidase/acylaminoacyl peptidase